MSADRTEDSKVFEQWYTLHAFDYPADPPIESRERALLRQAFLAGLAHARGESMQDAKDSECGSCASLLPGSYYMDPPDGGSVSVFEQLQRMAKDAARWKAFTSLDVDVYVNNFGMQWAGAGFAEGLQGLLDSLIADAAMEATK